MEWSKDGMGEVLMQVDGSTEARKLETKEKSGEKCEFENYMEGMRPWPIYFISRSMVSSLEISKHSFVGESATVRCSIVNFRRYV